MSTPSDDDIIIKGGSVSIKFNEGIHKGNNGQYGNPSRKIASVEVTDDNTGQVQKVNVPDNGKCTIRVQARWQRHCLGVAASVRTATPFSFIHWKLKRREIVNLLAVMAKQEHLNYIVIGERMFIYQIERYDKATNKAHLTLFKNPADFRSGKNSLVSVALKPLAASAERVESVDWSESPLANAQ
jgi:hypothetical protein